MNIPDCSCLYSTAFWRFLGRFERAGGDRSHCPQSRCQSLLKSKHSFMYINDRCLFLQTSIRKCVTLRVVPTLNGTHHSTHPTQTGLMGKLQVLPRLPYDPPTWLSLQGEGWCAAGPCPRIHAKEPRCDLGLVVQLRPPAATHTKGKDLCLQSQGACTWPSLQSWTSDNTLTAVQLLC